MYKNTPPMYQLYFSKYDSPMLNLPHVLQGLSLCYFPHLALVLPTPPSLVSSVNFISTLFTPSPRLLMKMLNKLRPSQSHPCSIHEIPPPSSIRRCLSLAFVYGPSASFQSMWQHSHPSQFELILSICKSVSKRFTKIQIYCIPSSTNFVILSKKAIKFVWQDLFFIILMLFIAHGSFILQMFNDFLLPLNICSITLLEGEVKTRGMIIAKDHLSFFFFFKESVPRFFIFFSQFPSISLFSMA